MKPSAGWRLRSGVNGSGRRLRDDATRQVRQAALFTGQAADHLDAAAGLPEGPLDQVGVADALAVLSREQQVDGERVEVVGYTGDRGGVQRCPLGDEPLGAPAGLSDGGVAVLLDVVEDRPVVSLH